MSAAPARGTVSGRRSRRPRRPHHKRQRRAAAARSPEPPEPEDPGEPGEKRPKVNPIFLWASQQEQRIVEVRCEDYDKRNRIKLTKTAQGWRSIPRTTIIPTTISPSNRVRLDSENERNDGERVGPDRRRYDSGEPCSDDDDAEEVENADQEDGDAEEAARLLEQQRGEHRRRLQAERKEQDEQRKNVAVLRLQPRVMLEQLKPSQLSALQNETIDSNREEMPRGVVSMLEATAASPEMAPMAADTPTADLPDSQECSPRSPSLIESISYPEDSALRPIQRRTRSRDDDVSTYTSIGDDYQNVMEEDSQRLFAETEDQSSIEDDSLDQDVLPVKLSDCKEEMAFEGPRLPATPVAKSNGKSDPSQHSRPIATCSERHLDDPILNALRNTPGLTVSVTSATRSRSPGPRIPASWKRPPPGLLISVPNDAKTSTTESPSTLPPIDASVCNATIPPANRGPITPTAIMSGLSISIPGYRYRPRPGPDSATTTTATPMTTEQRRRDDADSPESTTTQHRRPSSSATVDLEDSMSQGTTTTNTSVLQVSPQPSGIPCSPASGRPSSASGRPGSAYLELLLPSPPCSVSCSEDAKNDLTLKGILASPSRQLLRPSSEPNGIPDSREAVAGGNFDTASPFNALALGDRRSSEALARTPNSEALHDPAAELRDLLRTSGHLIPDPLLVPRDCLPALAAAPYTEIPKLLAARPELRLPQALTRPDLLRDPDLLVISLAHLQHVLDHGEGPVVPELRSSDPFDPDQQPRPKLTCKPIGTLMPGPIDLSATRDRSTNSQPLLRVRTTGLLKQEAEVTSTAASPEDSHLWHPLFGSQKRHHLQPFQETYFQRQHPHPHHHADENGHYQRGLRLQHRVHHQHHHHHHHPTHHHEQQQYQQGHPQQQEQQQQKQCAHAPWHRTTITS